MIYNIKDILLHRCTRKVNGEVICNYAYYLFEKKSSNIPNKLNKRKSLHGTDKYLLIKSIISRRLSVTLHTSYLKK